MTWSITGEHYGDESRKVRWETIPYTRGRVLDIGCGAYKVLPHVIGVDSGKQWGQIGIDVQSDASDLSLFADKSCDCVYSSHLLEHIYPQHVEATLKEWARVVKDGGYIVLHLPDEDQYPKCGTQYANPDHKWDVSYDKVVAYMDALDRGWDLVQFEKRDQLDEYSLFFVFKLTDGKTHEHSWKLPKPEKMCAVIRFGAIGDMIQMSSILPGLKTQGYHVTVYCQEGDGYNIIKHDPHIDRFIVQGHNQVPPQCLSEFFDTTRKKYDKWVNLCESVEVTLLAGPGRAAFDWPNDLRARMMNRNYLEFTHDLAEVPPPYQPKFYSTTAEKAWAKDKARSYGKRNILWSLSGSSGHKRWPHLDTILATVMLVYPDTHVVLVGDEICRILETGWENERRVHCMSGKWTIRESMAFAEQADLIIGNETGLLNAAGAMDAAKIVLLSHSSQEMLTKHWKNTVALEQPKGVGCNKQPCRQLHGANDTSTWADCPQHKETGTALCQFHIHPDMMWNAIESIMGVPQRKAA